MRLFNEILGTMLRNHIDFIRGFDGTHFSELYQKIFQQRNKEWANMDEYLFIIVLFLYLVYYLLLFIV